MIARILLTAAGALLVSAGLQAAFGDDSDDAGDGPDADDSAPSDGPDAQHELEQLRDRLEARLEELGDAISGDLRERLDAQLEARREANTETLERLRSIERRIEAQQQRSEDGGDPAGTETDDGNTPEEAT